MGMFIETIYIYIYIYRERERERQIDRYTETERDSERQRIIVIRIHKTRKYLYDAKIKEIKFAIQLGRVIFLKSLEVFIDICVTY